MSGNDVHPTHIFPLFLTPQTQSLFNCTAEEQVNETNPYKIITKADILTDFKNRAAVSDFHPAKQIIKEWPDDNLLLVFDPNFQYGQNFYLILDEDEIKELLNPPDNSDVIESVSTTSDDLPYQARVNKSLRRQKDWVSYGSDREIKESVYQERSKITIKVSRKRGYFGGPLLLSDRVEDIHKPGVIVHCQSYKDEEFLVKRELVDKCVQSIPKTVHATSQTNFPSPRNNSVQYYPRYYPQNVSLELMATQRMKKFFEEITPR